MEPVECRVHRCRSTLKFPHVLSDPRTSSRTAPTTLGPSAASPLCPAYVVEGLECRFDGVEVLAETGVFTVDEASEMLRRSFRNSRIRCSDGARTPTTPATVLNGLAIVPAGQSDWDNVGGSLRGRLEATVHGGQIHKSEHCRAPVRRAAWSGFWTRGCCWASLCLFSRFVCKCLLCTPILVNRPLTAFQRANQIGSCGSCGHVLHTARWASEEGATVTGIIGEVFCYYPTR